jgi:hypothetical protein
MEATWIHRSSLDALLEYLAGLVSYRWDPSDEEAVAAGIADTNDEASRWFRYEIRGVPELVVELACDPESPIVLHVRLMMPPALACQIRTALAIAGAYVVTRRT